MPQSAFEICQRAIHKATPAMWLLASLLVGILAPSDPGSAAQPVVIIDENAYWRYCLVGGPVPIDHEVLKRDGKATLGEQHWQRLERETLRDLSRAGKKTDDWMSEVLYPAGYLNLSRLNEVRTTPPRIGWAQPDFDDSDWSCYRKPFKIGKDFYLDGFVDHFFHVKTTCFRTVLEVTDPAAAGELLLKLTYRGGVRALLNGREIGRGHLPAAGPGGELGADVLAEPYPRGAYFALKGEHPGLDNPRMTAWMVGDDVICPDMNVFADRTDEFEGLQASEQVPGPYRRVHAIGYGGRCYINRAGWDRIRKLRNRQLAVRIPPGTLRKGANVLAVEVRTSTPHPVALRWHIAWEGSASWKHGWLMKVELTGSGKGITPPMRRPAGVQVWGVDVHHRMYSPEFCPPGPQPHRLRMAAPRNGICSGQLAIGTDAELTGLNATVSQFTAPGGHKLPPATARVLYLVGHPEWELKCAGEGKGFAGDAQPGFARGNTMVTLDRYAADKGLVSPDETPGAVQAAREGARAQASKVTGGQEGEGGAGVEAAAGGEASDADVLKALRERELKRIQFFDHLSPMPPASVPADTCQPVWIAVKVPPDAAPGTYHAKVEVRADGMEAVTLPVELKVADWRMPDPKDFQTIMCLEQSPYAVARHYKVPLWSDEHFRLLERSFELLGAVGNDFLAIPVVARTEFGNSTDSPLRIVRRADGELECDFTIVERYLDMAVKHWGRPFCVAFTADHCGGVPYGQTVDVFDAATRRSEAVQIGPQAPEAVRRQYWRAIAVAITRHMKARGLGKSLYWGVHGDSVNDPSLPLLLREFAPEVTWVRYSHQYRPDETYTLCANVRGAWSLPTTSLMGWKSLAGQINLWLPRHWNSVAVAEGKSAPFAFRLGIERALVSGAPGVARMGADYWDGTWLHDFPLQPYCGMPILFMFYPGPEAAESSIRYEMLREGLQATETRIFLEQAVAKLGDEALTKEMTRLLDRRIHDTLFPLVYAPHIKIEEYHTGWHERSEALLAAAARVGQRVGVDLARSAIEAEVPARGSRTVRVDLRNWTSGPRAWKARARQDWLRPARASGRLAPGNEPLEIVIDAADLEPGRPVTGLLELTDVESGRTETLSVAVSVSEVLRLLGPKRAINIDAGGTGELAFTLLNPSAKELSWRINPSVSWVRCETASGVLPVGRQCGVRIAISPPGRERAVHEIDLTITETGGTKRHERLRVHVLPSRTQHARRPGGQAVPLESVPVEAVTAYVNGGRQQDLRRGVRFHKPDPKRPLGIGRKTEQDWQSVLKKYERGLELGAPGELAYGIEGKGFASFSAEVGWSNQSRIEPEARAVPRLHFEIYVDGRLADHSGLMRMTDPPRMLVADGLRGAKEIRLVVRLADDGLAAGTEHQQGRVQASGVWAEPAFHK